MAKDNIITTEVQKTVIGSLAMAPQYLYLARQIVSETMFDGVCKDAWKTILSMADNKEPIEFATVGARIDKSLLSYLMVNIDKRYTEKDITYYCNALRTEWMRAQLTKLLLDMIHKVGEPTSKIEDLVAMPAQLTEQIKAVFGMNSDNVSLPTAISNYLDSLSDAEAMKEKGQTMKIPTGIDFLDKLLFQGFAPGDLAVIGARPGNGKTAVSLQFARTASDNGKHVLMFELEMTNDQISQRSILSTGAVNSFDLQEGHYDWDALEIAARQFDNSLITLNTKARTYEDIVSRIILARQQGLCDMAVIDHLGLIKRPESKNMTLAQQLEEFTTGFKTLALEQGIPIILLAQLNRDSAKTNREPELQDLRNSGGIEQDADIVILLQKDKNDESILHLYPKKNRQGQSDNIDIELEASRFFTTFKEKK